MARYSLLLLAILGHCRSQSAPQSPCPGVFKYEPSSEAGKWFGVVTLTTDITLHGIWLNVLLDNKADILGNWIGDVTTSDNTDFKIENTTLKLYPDAPLAVRFFIQFNQYGKTPRISNIRLNGREICAVTLRPVYEFTIRPEDIMAVRDESKIAERPVKDVVAAKPIREERPTYADGAVGGVNPYSIVSGSSSQDLGTSQKKRPSVTTATQTRPDPIDSSRPSYVQPKPSRPSYDLDSTKPSPRPSYDLDSSKPSPSRPSYDLDSTKPSPSRPSYDLDSTKPNPSRPSYDLDSTKPSPSRPNYDLDSTKPNPSRPSYDLDSTKPSPSRPGYEVESYDAAAIGHEDRTPVSRPGYESETEVRPSYDRPSNRRTTKRPTGQSTEFQDYTEDGSPSEGDYFTGGLPSIHAVLSSKPSDPSVAAGDNEQCGRPVHGATPLIVNGRETAAGQWPWQIALYQTQTVDSKYICGGTLVSLRHVVTAAHCVTLKGSSHPANRNTFTVYLGKHNLRTSVEGVQIKFIASIHVHPAYNASSYSRDAAVLKLRDRAEYTEYVRPACLWPSDQADLSYIVNKIGAVTGWGFDEKGLATEELHLVEMPVVDQETCIRSYSEFFARFTSQYTYCAGFRDGRSVCNGDSGGGMVFRVGGAWRLRGLVSLSSARQNDSRCDTAHYVIFTDLAKMLRWLTQRISE